MTSRRDFIKTSGFLVVGLSVAGDLPLVAQGLGAGPYPDVDFRQLDSWIVIRQDNTATFFVGKTDLGQGTGTAFRQVMADELDMPYDKTSCVMGNTDVTVDQGGSGGSDALQTDGYPMRRVAAEQRSRPKPGCPETSRSPISSRAVGEQGGVARRSVVVLLNGPSCGRYAAVSAM